MRRQNWRRRALPRFLLSLCNLGIVDAINSCSSATLTSQEDANAISGCSTITGNVVLATNAAGSIALDGVHLIEGSLSTADCSSSTTSSCSGLLSLSSSTLSTVSDGFKLQSFSNLLNISFPQMLSTGPTFSLDDLSSLQIVTVPKLSSAEDFHISNTPSLTSLSLDVLKNVTSAYINNVALSTLPLINSIWNIKSFTATGINNVSSITLNTTSIGLLEIQGNGTLRLGLMDVTRLNITTLQDSQVLAVETLNVSGCQSIVLRNTTISNLNSTGNNFTEIDFDQVQGMQNIYIIDNPLLENVVFPNTSVLNSLTLSNNPLLTQSTFWKGFNITTFALTGTISAAYAEMVELYISYILGDAYIDAPGVSCVSWDNFREQGHVLGNYSCNGKTVAIKNTGAASHGLKSAGALTLWTAIFTIFFYI